MAFFAEHGFPPAEFRRIAVGPVMRKDEVEYFSAGGDLAATVRSTGGWLDLRARKLVAPPEQLFAAFAQVPRAPGYVELPSKERSAE